MTQTTGIPSLSSLCSSLSVAVLPRQVIAQDPLPEPKGPTPSSENSPWYYDIYLIASLLYVLHLLIKAAGLLPIKEN